VIFMENVKELEAQLQKEMEEAHAQREIFEAELAGSKGEAYPDDRSTAAPPLT
jgi:hypothetical protein